MDDDLETLDVLTAFSRRARLQRVRIGRQGAERALYAIDTQVVRKLTRACRYGARMRTPPSCRSRAARRLATFVSSLKCFSAAADRRMCPCERRTTRPTEFA
jgi:hypothetical protein